MFTKTKTIGITDMFYSKMEGIYKFDKVIIISSLTGVLTKTQTWYLNNCSVNFFLNLFQNGRNILNLLFFLTFIGKFVDVTNIHSSHFITNLCVQ